VRRAGNGQAHAVTHPASARGRPHGDDVGVRRGESEHRRQAHASNGARPSGRPEHTPSGASRSRPSGNGRRPFGPGWRRELPGWRARGNGMKATAAAMRYGYWRGEPFEGSETTSRGERLGARGFCGSERERVARNAMNPKAGSGAQQTRNPCAEQAVEVVRNHEGGTRSVGGTTSPKGGVSRRMPGSGRTGGKRRRGTKRARPREEEPRPGSPGRGGFQRSRERSGDEAKVMRVDLLRESTRHGKTSRARPATAQGRGGSREVQRPATGEGAGAKRMPTRIRRPRRPRRPRQRQESCPTPGLESRFCSIL
jgi:hypothetical protein